MPKACKTVPVPQRLSHADRAARRKRIASAAKRGTSLATIAAKEGVTLKTVRDACREFGVKRRK